MPMDSRTRNGQLKALVYADTSSIHGTGLFAARNIARNEYIGTYWGPQAKRDGTYVLWVYEPDKPEHPIGRSGRNLLRFLNHADRPNAAFDAFDLFAAKAIRAGEEITIDYGAA